MRVLSLAAIVAAIMLMAPPTTQGAGLSISSYQFVSQQRVSASQFNITYQAQLLNSGGSLSAVTATLTSLNTASFQIIPGLNTLNFAPVPANSQVPSSNTFTILVDRSVNFDFANLQWTFQSSGLPPVANAGANQTAKLNSTVTLNGSASTNPSGIGTLSYNWVFTQIPNNSAAKLLNASTVMPTFVVDVAGSYQIMLTVSNGSASSSASVTVSTVSTPPVANAGANQTVPVGSVVILNGSGSSDIDGNPLVYKWSLVSAPAGSLTSLSDPNSVTPNFKVDKFGNYVAQLIVTDGNAASAPSTVNINTSHTPPVANAGANQKVAVGALVQLTGAGSTDVDGNTLTYSWTLINVPQGSNAVISSSSSVNPTFTADVPGTYVAQLIVSDQYFSSTPSTVTITTNTVLPPTVSAGQNQTVTHNTMVQLTGNATDPQGLTVTYQWSITNKPTGSMATLSNSKVSNPSFLADQSGTYVAQVIASNGFMSSAPATVTVNTTDTPPIANAGQNQNVKTGSTVILDGSGSYDPDGDKITFSWSFLSVPNGSVAALTGATTSTPVFVADQSGTYVAQLIVNDGTQNSLQPSTVTITANSSVAITLSPSVLNLSTASPGTLTVTLPFAAGPSGQVVSLTSTNVTIANAPSSVLVPSGAFSTTFSVTPVGVGTATIIATVPTSVGYTPGNSSINVSTASITLTPNPMNAGVTRTAQGTITLSGPPATDLFVSLAAVDPTIVSVASPVIIPAGTTSAPFTITGAGTGSTTINATASGYSSGSTNVLVTELGKVNIPQNTTIGPNQSLPYIVSLATPAPVGGVTVTLTSNNSSIATISPSTVFVPFQALAPTTQPTLTGVQYGTTSITASAPGFYGDTESVQVTGTLSFSPQNLTITGSTASNLTLSLSSPAPAGGLPISLTSVNPSVATVPATVIVKANASAVLVPVTPVASSTASTTISATANIPGNPSATAIVTVQVAGAIGLQSPGSVPLGQTIALTINLPSLTGPNGTVVNLSSDSTKITINPSSISIPAFTQTASIQPQITGVGVGAATITATSPDYQKGTATVNVTSTASLSPNPFTINGAITQNATLTLAANTASAVTISLSSDTPSVATVPASVVVQAGTNSVQVPIAGISSGTATIHANSTFVPDTTLSVTVNAPKPIGLTQGISVGLGQSATLQVTLPTAATSATTVNLSSSDSTTVSVSPSSVTIPVGGTTPPAQPTVTGLKPGSATVSATTTGTVYGAASSSVQVTASLAFQTPMVTVGTGATLNLVLQLSGPAPAAGLIVNLQSSSPSIASAPATVSFQPGATTVNVPVTGILPGPATISASATNVTGATASVTVATLGNISVPNSVTVSPSQTAGLSIALNPVPTSAVTLSLSSSNPSVATVPATVVVNANSASPAVQPQVTGVGYGNATISVSGTGYQTANSTVMVGASLSFPAGPITVGGGATQSITLTLSAPAPSSGLTVNLSSSNTAFATVPASISFGPNATTAPVPVTGITTGSATITATTSAPNVTGASVNVSVLNGLVLPNVTVSPGSATPFPLSLSMTYPNNVVVTLTSSDSTKVALNGSGASAISFIVPAGQLSPNVNPKVYGIDFGSATITANAYGLPTVSTTVPVTAAISFFPASANINPNATKTLTLNLAAQSPGGVTVQLKSDNPSVATVPASVTFGPVTMPAADGPQYVTSVTVPVTGLANGTTLIHAFSQFTPDTTASITVGTGTAGTLAITTSSLPNGVVGTAYSTLIVASGGSTPYTFAASGLPAGLSINPSTGAITGTPTAVFTGAVTFQVTDSSSPTHQQATSTLSLSITASSPGVTITTATLPTGTQGQSYSASLNASGGTTPYTWSATGLPNGLSISSTTGAISGTPTATGSSQVAVTVTDSSATKQTATANFVLAINPPATLNITTTSLPNGTQGSAYSATLIVTGGNQPYSWSATGLPNGLSISAAGVISGTPTATGTSQVAVTVTDSSSPKLTATANFSLAVTGGALTITNTSLPDGFVGVPYSNFLTATGGTPPYTWSIINGRLPSIYTLNQATGEISGTALCVCDGMFTVIYKVMDSAGQSSTKSLTVNIDPAVLTITNTSMTNGQVGARYSFTPTAVNGTAPLVWSLRGGVLPSWASFDPNTGTVAGTPTAPLTNSPLVFYVTDSSSPVQTAQKTLTLTVTGGQSSPLSISTTSLPAGVVNNVYSATLSATGGATPYTWSASNLPAGLNISSSGVISGTPTVAVSNQLVAITVKDSSSPQQTVSANIAITVTAAATPLNIQTNSLPAGTYNVAYSATVAATGGTSPYVWSASGLPSGLSINSLSGVISGTPSVSIQTNVTITVKDSGSPAQTQSVTLPLTINIGNGGGGALTITAPNPLPDGFVNVAYSVFLTATGGMSPYTWSRTSGRLPPGYSLNSSTGQISGVSTNQYDSANSQITFMVTDAAGNTASMAFSITVLPQQLTITTLSPLPSGTVGVPYSTTFTAVFGTTPYTWVQATGAMPAGLTFNPANATISGTPTVAGTQTFSITVRDSATPFATDNETYQLTINPGGPPSITTGSLPGGSVGTAYSTTLSGTGGAPPYTWSATGLPNGIQINGATGAIFGTPTAAGTSQVGITLTDSSSPAKTATRTLSLTITTAKLTITTTSLPGGTPGQPYSATLTATGGTQPYNWAVSGLPGGLTVNPSTGVISGTPSGAGTSPLTVSITDSSAPQQSATTTSLSIVVSQLLTITATSPLANGQVNVAYSAQLSAAGGKQPYIWSASGLPAGLSINQSTGLISGTPTQSIQTTASITVKDSSTPQQTQTQGFQITIIPPKVQITTTALPNGVVGSGYNTTLAATGGTTPYSWSASGLPTGLSINSSTGVISGTPQQVVSPTVTITVTDSSSPAQTATANLTLNVVTMVTTLSITTTSLPAGTQGVFYNQTVSATGGAAPYSWSATGLPAGLGISSSSGVISGTPTATGTSVASIKVQDSSSQTATANLSITINSSGNGPLNISTISLPVACAGSAYNTTMAATGGTPPYTWIGNNLPTGLSIDPNSGVISGSAASAGTTTASFIVTDSTAGTHQRATASLSITVANCGGITLSNPSIGLNLQALVTVSVATAPPSGSGGLPITLTSQDSTKLLLYNGQNGGVSTLNITIPELATSVQVVAQGIALGNVVLMATSAGMTGQTTIPIVPSGFVLLAPNGTHAFSINQGTTANLTVSPWPLDSNSTQIGTQPQAIRQSGNAANPFTVTVPLSSSNAAVGSISQSVTFTSGDTSQIALFTSQTTNSQTSQTTTLTVNPPAGYGTPAGGASQVTATVNPLTCTLPAVTVGNGLETTAHVTLAGATSSALPVIISGSGQVLFSTSATQQGSSSIQVTVPLGATRSPDFYIIGGANSGSATYTANTGSAFGSCNGAVSLVAAGFEISSPYGLGISFPTSVSAQSGIVVTSVALDASLDQQPLAGGSSVTVTVTATDVQGSGIGNMNPSSVTLTGGQGTGNLIFNATAAGKSQIAVVQPNGFSAPPQFTSLIATVAPTVITLCPAQELGFDLQLGCTVSISAQAPSGGLSVTLTSNSPQLLLSPDGVAAGTQTLQVKIPAGAQQAQFFFESFSSTGIAAVTASATGFQSGNTSVTFRPTGIALLSPGGGTSFTTNVASGPSQLIVYLLQFDGSGNLNTANGPGVLAAGVTLPLTITSSNPAVGKVTSPNFGVTPVFTPLSIGQTQLTIATPTNFTATGYQAVTANVPQ